MKSNKELYPITSSQFSLIISQLYTIEPLTVRATNYINAYFIVPQDCNYTALEKAFNRVIEQNDSLRLRIVFRKLGLYQYIEDYAPQSLDVVCIDDNEDSRQAYINSVLKHKTRLFNSNLVWAQIARSGTGGILLMQFHHICVDGYSLNIIFKSLERYYDCFAQGKELPEEKKYSITRFFDSEAKYLKSPQFEKDRIFWKKAFNNQPDYKFPAGHRSPFSISDSQSITIYDQTYQKLYDFYRANNCTMQTTIMSLLAMLVYFDTDAKNFAICTSWHNRNSPVLRQTVGCMVNASVTFFDIDTSMTFEEFVRDSHMRILMHLSHGKTPVSVQDRYIFKESIKHGLNFFHQWLVVSNMSLADTFDEIHYPAGVLPLSNVVQQMYCALLDIPQKSLTVRLTYQRHKFKKEKIADILDKLNRMTEIALENPNDSIDVICSKLRREAC